MIITIMISIIYLACLIINCVYILKDNNGVMVTYSK